MLLAIESTEVAEQDQNCRTTQELAGVEYLAIERLEVEVKVDPHAAGSVAL